MLKQKDLLKSKELQRDHYLRCNEMTKNNIRANSPENEFISYTRLLNLLKKQGNFLDVGCQTGIVYKYLQNDSRFSVTYYGIEILEEVAQRAIKNGTPNVSVGYMEKMPYENNFFDIIWARHVLEHSVDIDIVLQEFKRVLKKDGQVGFIAPSVLNNEPAHLIQYTKDDWNKAFIRNGFEIIKSYEHDFNLNEYCGVLKLKVY